MKHRNIIVFGGSGFVGGHVVARLVTGGARVTVVTRRMYNANRLILLPTVHVVEADVYDMNSIEPLLVGKDAVINLIGVLHSDKGTPFGRAFASAHVELPRTLVAACQRAGVRRLLHMSALGAATDAPSMYLRSKAFGESMVLRQHLIDATVFRPAPMFGPDDRFLNVFARLQRFAPVVPLAGAHARFAPVFVGDVADAFIKALDERECVGKIYESTGPRVYTLAELVRLAGAAIGHARPILPLPGPLGRLQAFLLECLPGRKMMSRDNLDSMKVDCVASGRLPGLDAPELLGQPGWHPTPLDPVAIDDLALVHVPTRLDVMRARAHR